MERNGIVETLRKGNVVKVQLSPRFVGPGALYFFYEDFGGGTPVLGVATSTDWKVEGIGLDPGAGSGMEWVVASVDEAADHVMQYSDHGAAEFLETSGGVGIAGETRVRELRLKARMAQKQDELDALQESLNNL